MPVCNLPIWRLEPRSSRGPVTYPSGAAAIGALVPGTTYPGSGTSLDPRGLGISPTVQTIWNNYMPESNTSSCAGLGSRCDGLNVLEFKANMPVRWSDNFAVARLDRTTILVPSGISTPPTATTTCAATPTIKWTSDSTTQACDFFETARFSGAVRVCGHGEGTSWITHVNVTAHPTADWSAQLVRGGPHSRGISKRHSGRPRRTHSANGE